MSQPVPKPKPLVQAACVCEKVLREHDDVPSLIRLVDLFTLDPPPNLALGAGVALPLTIFVSLKSGGVVGEHTLRINLTSPNGTSTRVSDWPVIFAGAESGAHLQIAFTLQAPEEGLYWFDVLWVDEVLTRIPVRVRTESTTPSSAAPSATESKQPTAS